jgi:branched-chain amino acid transport system permease protein
MVFAAFGAALVMRHLVVLVWGHESHYYTRELQMAVEVLPAVLPGVRMLPDQLFILGLTLAVMAALHAFLTWSRTGIAMRAMAESPALAQVCGIPVAAVVRLTWIISGGAGGVRRRVHRLTPQIHPEIGFNLLLSLFAAAILGGTGSLAGAVIGGFLGGPRREPVAARDQPRLQGRDAVPAAARDLARCGRRASSATGARCSPTSCSSRASC